MLSVKKCLTDIVNWCKQFVTKDATSQVTCTKKSGNSSISSFKMSKYGNMITIWMNVLITGSVSSGSNILTATISKYHPALSCSSYTYSGSHSIGGLIDGSGNITLRLGNTNSAAGNTIGISFVYFIK